MRSHLAKALAVILLAAFFGIPMGLYTERFREDAMAMSQEEWLEMMQYEQSSYEHSTGLTGMLFLSLIGFAGLVCIYEFTKMVSARIIDLVLGPEQRDAT